MATSSPAKTAAKTPATEAPRPKQKLVRDSFTIPKTEYLVLDELKLRAAKLQRPIKKGELIRAGIGALNKLTDAPFLAALNAVPSLKTGRPKDEKPVVKKASPKPAEAASKAAAKASSGKAAAKKAGVAKPAAEKPAAGKTTSKTTGKVTAKAAETAA